MKAMDENQGDLDLSTLAIKNKATSQPAKSQYLANYLRVTFQRAKDLALLCSSSFPSTILRVNYSTFENQVKTRPQIQKSSDLYPRSSNPLYQMELHIPFQDRGELASESEFAELFIELSEKILDFESDQGFKMQKVFEKKIGMDEILGDRNTIFSAEKNNFSVRLGNDSQLEGIWEWVTRKEISGMQENEKIDELVYGGMKNLLASEKQPEWNNDIRRGQKDVQNLEDPGSEGRVKDALDTLEEIRRLNRDLVAGSDADDFDDQRDTQALAFLQSAIFGQNPAIVEDRNLPTNQTANDQERQESQGLGETKKKPLQNAKEYPLVDTKFEPELNAENNLSYSSDKTKESKPVANEAESSEEEKEDEKSSEVENQRLSEAPQFGRLEPKRIDNIRDIYPDFNFDYLNAFVNNQSGVSLTDSQKALVNTQKPAENSIQGTLTPEFEITQSRPGENPPLPVPGPNLVEDAANQDRTSLVKSQISNPFEQSLLPKNTKPTNPEVSKNRPKDESSSLSNKITESLKQRLPKELVSDTDLERISRIFKNENLGGQPGQNWRWSSSEDEF